MNDKNKNSWNRILCAAGCALGLGLIILIFTSEDKGAYVEALPFLIFLLCPIMHIFMHKGHNKKDRHENEGGDKARYKE